AIQAVKTARVEQPVLALVRPPGHHAEPAAGMGFCVFSNAALAAHWARANGGPTLIVDFDYHHGNGTQAWVERALSEAGSPLGFISTHASPAYPGTGHFSESRLEERGFIVDIPLGLGTETDDFIAVWAALLPPLTRRLQPRTIVVSAGFDFLRDDPIAGLPVEQRAVDALCALLSDVAAAQRAPLALVLEGGYSLANMRRSGDCLARSFGKHACALHLAAAARPQDPDLAAMVSRVLAWLD
ncbi:MAG: histone deacetylase, partial [Candidatus Eremiobacteraeota bacterium]|nr:histone deacetylase [Candidatus Eremiobacteraeota bacterium]